MLESYFDTQNVATTMLVNALKDNRLNHAYLIESNDNNDAFKIALAFAKAILCEKHYINNEKCINCVKCTQIDNNTFSELKIIEPDGLQIKKGQLEILQKEFSKTAIQSNKRVYIINQADRLNSEAANSILKFLEEPVDGIIAILITSNIYQMMETILSRCQVVPLLKNKISDDESYLEKLKYYFNKKEDDEILLEKTKQYIKFINLIQTKKEETIISTNKIIGEFVKDKDECLFLFDFMVFFYKDCLNYLLDRKLELFSQNDIETIVKNNNIESLRKKINIVLNLKNRIYNNANTNLLLDKLVITLTR